MKYLYLILFSLCILFLFSPNIEAQNSQRKVKGPLQTIGQAESVGISPERLERLSQFLDQELKNQQIPGSVALIARKGKIVYYEANGSNGIGKNSPMQKDDIFRIASMTKPITSTAIMILYEEGKLLLDDPVSKYIPAFAKPQVLKDFNPEDSSYITVPAKSEITIRQLLTHTSGISYGFMNPKVVGAIYAKAGVPDITSMEEIKIGDRMKILAKLPLMHEPGTRMSYGLSTDVLGYLVEVLSGQSLADFFQSRIFDPLGMEDTRFFHPKSTEKRLVRMFFEDENGKVQAYTDEPLAKMAYFPTRGAKTYYSGGGGLSSTTEDYFKFCQMILNKGEYNGARILSPKTVELMSQNHLGKVNFAWGPEHFGLGFSIATPQSAAKHLGSVGRLGWGGAFNTTFWIDPKEEVIAILMTQIYPSRRSAELYEKFENMVYQSIIE